MTERQFLPYPRGVSRWLLRLPIPLYRLGLGDLLNAANILILGTRGRKSGLPRYTPIEYRCHGSKLYLVSAWGEQPHWFQNLRAEPNVLVQQGRRRFSATANLVTNSGEALRVIQLFRRRAPFVYDPIIARLSARDSVNARSLPDVSSEITIVRLDPALAVVDLPPLKADYRWALPALLLVSLAALLLIARPRDAS